MGSLCWDIVVHFFLAVAFLTGLPPDPRRYASQARLSRQRNMVGAAQCRNYSGGIGQGRRAHRAIEGRRAGLGGKFGVMSPLMLNVIGACGVLGLRLCIAISCNLSTQTLQSIDLTLVVKVAIVLCT